MVREKIGKILPHVKLCSAVPVILGVIMVMMVWLLDLQLPV